MKNSPPLKIGKAVLKTGRKIFKFSLKMIIAVLDASIEKEDFREWQDDYEEYERAVTRRKSF